MRRGAGFTSSNEPVVHFGLGADTTLLQLHVTWPGGGTQEFLDVPGRKLITVTQNSDTLGVD
jgi:hypothetical protein